MPKVGDHVRIIDDEYPQLIGLVGQVTQISSDGMAAWVERHPPHGVWCSISNLRVVPPGKSLRDVARERGINSVGTDLDIETGKRVISGDTDAQSEV